MHEKTWDEDSGRHVEVSRWLFNPFHYVAGAKALAIGMLTLLFTGIFGFLGGIRFDGILDFHMGLPPLRIWCHVAENFISWILLSVLLFSAGKLVSKSRPRPIDVFGTQALARIPYLLVALMALMSGSNRFIVGLLNGSASWNHFSMDMAVFLFVAVAGLVMMIWMIALMYRAFAVSCNVSGRFAVTVFAIALIVGEILSKIIVYRLFPIVMTA